jgi:sugar phosphate isomerase/epimerase
MQYGVCGGFEIARFAAEAGFDYFEMSVGSLLKPLEGNEAFEANIKILRSLPLPCTAVNVFVPPQMKITGPEVDFNRLQEYVSTTCQRAEMAGVKTIVFGSGGARQIPSGFTRPAAWQQLLEFCGMLGPIAHDHGIIIAIEPLNKSECNVINSVGEGAELTRQVSYPSIRLLVDAYHWAKDGDSLEDLVKVGPLLSHAHIATLANRRTPGVEADDFTLFFEALRQGGYFGPISIEGRIDDPFTELPIALKLFRKYS